MAALIIYSPILASSANAETRTLRMYFTHTKESATITFKKNGRYVKSGLRKANRFLRDWRRKEPTKMDPELLDLVWEVYQKSGSRKPIHVISGYRSPRTNKLLRRRGRKVARNSQHTRGKALDFFMPDVSVSKLRALGLKAHRGGVGYYRGSFVHLDTGNVRHWPRMSRRQLAKVFPRGKTIHVPSNGRPLKGYKIAQANLKRGLNADGSKRTTKVAKSLLARIFSGKGGGGDEGEAVVALKAKPKPRKPKPRKAAPKKPVAVAAAKPKPPTPKKPTGPDPFSLENSAAKQKQSDELKAKEAERAKALALAEEQAQKDAEVASFIPKRIPVPRVRPTAPQAQTQLALASTTEEDTLAPVQQAQLALLSPATENNAVVRPSVDVPQTSSNQLEPVKQAPEPNTQKSETQIAKDQDVEDLKSRITTALARGRAVPPSEGSANQAANTRLALALKSLPVPKSAVRASQAISQVETAQPQQVPLPKSQTTDQNAIARNLEVAALVPSADQASTPTWRSQSALEKTGIKDPVKPASLAVPLPTSKPNVARFEPAITAIATGAPIAMKSALSLGNLDGRTVKKWAVSTSTRIGASAVLRAPDYKQGARRAAPNSVYSVGFAQAKFPIRSDRFSGRSLTRVAFAHFGLNQ